MKVLLINFRRHLKEIVKINRIKEYGLGIILCEILILLCHRKNTQFEQWITRIKDKKIHQYLEKKYWLIIKEYILNEKR